MEYLVITLQAPQRIDIWQKITKLVAEMDCNLSKVHGQKLAEETALVALISGNWNTIAKLETALTMIKSEPEVQLHIKRSKLQTGDSHLLPYSVQVIALDQIGTLQHICKFFAEHDITIENLDFDSYESNATRAKMCSLNLSLGVPSIANIGELREEFMIFCDELNIDGIIEPEKR